MSLLKNVFNAVRKIFKVAVKKRRSPNRASKTVKRIAKVRRSSPARKFKSPSAKKRSSPKKGYKPAKSKTKKQTASLSQSKNKTNAPKHLSKSAQVGEVTHYFDKIKVCVIRIDKGIIKRGDRLTISGNKGSLSQVVSSMQIENEEVISARKGQLIGLKVVKEVHAGDSVAKSFVDVPLS